MAQEVKKSLTKVSLCYKQQSDSSFIEMISLSSTVAETYEIEINGT